jgi:hypothetical protein
MLLVKEDRMSEIYRQLARLCPPFSPRKPWGFLAASPNVRVFPDDPTPVLASLRESRTDRESPSDEQLASSGVLVRTQDGLIEISPNLLTDPGIFLTLREGRNQAPHEILGPQGLLNNRRLPCLSAPRDSYTKECLEVWNKRLFAAFDVKDLAVLRLLRLPVTLAHNLERLSGHGLRLVCGDPVGDNRQGKSRRERAPGLWRHVEKLILVGWSIADLELREPQGLRPVAALLDAAQEHLGFDVSHIRVWRPSDSQLRQIGLAARLGDRALVKQAISDGVARSCRGVEDFAGHPKTSASDEFLVARRELMEELQREQKQRSLSVKMPTISEHYNRAYERAFVEPLVHEAASAAAPLDQALLMAASEVTQQWHNSSPLVSGCAENTSRPTLPWTISMSPEELKERLKLTDQLIAIRRELRGKQ